MYEHLKFTVLLLFAMISSLSSEQITRTRVQTQQITMGSIARPGQFPFYLSMICSSRSRPGLSKNCGASLLNENWALTAAHCIRGIDKIVLGLNSTNLLAQNRISSDKYYMSMGNEWIAHPQFDRPTKLANDIALVYIKSLPTQFRDPKYFVQLPKMADKRNTFVNSEAFIMGHGKTEKLQVSEELRFGQMVVVDSRECKKRFDEGVTENVLCAKGKKGAQENACQGDSGGPLVIQRGGKWVQVGVLSFTLQGNCMVQESGYTKVANYLEWISKTTGIKVA